MSVIDQIFEKAKLNPQRVVFPEALNEKMMQAAMKQGQKDILFRFLLEMQMRSGKRLQKEDTEKTYFIS